MSNFSTDPELLTIRELMYRKGGKEFSFSIPLYQRAYAWGPDEIDTLINDIVDCADALRTDNTSGTRYSLGSLVVHRAQGTATYEVVDGQQRLTTLYLMLCALHNKVPTAKVDPLPSDVLSFSNRPEANRALRLIADDEVDAGDLIDSSVADPLFRGYRYIKTRLTDSGVKRTDPNAASLDYDIFRNQLLDQTVLLLIPLPERTDLNHYFEIMNTRGVQLQAHEIVKARLMGLLKSPNEQHDREKADRSASTFSMIWDACAHMDGYVQQGFKKEQRNNLFGDDWSTFEPTSFEDIEQRLSPCTDGDGVTTDDTSSTANTLDDVLTKALSEAKPSEGLAHDDAAGTEDDDGGRFTSILDFPNFLIHALKLFRFSESGGSDNIVLNDKNLLDYFDKSKFTTAKQVKDFTFFILKTRFVFDMFIIKNDTVHDKTREQSNWSLCRMMKREKTENTGDTYSFQNTFGQTSESMDGIDSATASTGSEAGISVQRDIVMLESMNQVTYTARTSKTFVQDYLKYLLPYIKHPSTIHLSSMAPTFREALWTLAVQQCKQSLGDDYSSRLKNAYPDGVDIFTFNFLDYVLWRYRGSADDRPHANESEDLYKKVHDVWSSGERDPAHPEPFTFRYRNSIEHFFPQHPESGTNQALEPKYLNAIGNLCLLSKSENSRRSNLTPEAKVDQFNSTMDEQSLKFRIMANITTENHVWKEKQIEKHTEDTDTLFRVLMGLAITSK